MIVSLNEDGTWNLRINRLNKTVRDIPRTAFEVRGNGLPFIGQIVYVQCHIKNDEEGS